MKKIYLSAVSILIGSVMCFAQVPVKGVLGKTNTVLHDTQPGSALSKTHPQNHVSSVADDIGLLSTFPGPYTMIPFAQLQPFNFDARIVNVGTNVATNSGFNVNVYLFQNGLFVNVVYTASSTLQDTLNAGDTSAVLSAGSYTPIDTGVYYFEYVTFMDNIDLDNSNDTLIRYIVVNDSTYAKDYAAIDNLLQNAVGFTGGSGTLGQKFEVFTPATLTSASFYLAHGVIGDRISVTIYSINGSGFPSAQLGHSAVDTLTDADTAGVFITLPLTAPISVNPGSFFIGLNQITIGHNVNLGMCNDIYTPGTVFYRGFGASVWSPIDSAGLLGSFILRPNTGTIIQGVRQHSPVSSMQVYPNPTTGLIHFTADKFLDTDYTVTVYNESGQVVDIEKQGNLLSDLCIDLSGFPAGVYTVVADSRSFSTYKSVVLINR